MLLCLVPLGLAEGQPVLNWQAEVAAGHTDNLFRSFSRRGEWTRQLSLDLACTITGLEFYYRAQADLSRRDLPIEATQELAPTEAGTEPASTALPDQVEALERQAIRDALAQANGVQSRAAELLGLTERNLRYKLRKHRFK